MGYLASKNSNNEDQSVVDKLQNKDADSSNNSTLRASKILEVSRATTDVAGVVGTTTTTKEIAAGMTASSSSTVGTTVGTNKRTFFNALDTTVHLNDATPERTQLLTKMVNEKLMIDVENSVDYLLRSDNEKEKDDGIGAKGVVPTISYNQPGWMNTFLSVPPPP